MHGAMRLPIQDMDYRVRKMRTDDVRTATMKSVEEPKTFILPTQRSQWLTSALSHAYTPTSQANIDNEIIVLSTGIDQYIQEVFFHLGNKNRITGVNEDDGEPEAVSLEDFKILCQLLAADDEIVNDEKRLECNDDDDRRIGFQSFHSRLIEIFAEIDDDNSQIDDEEKKRENQNRWRSDEEMVEAGINIPNRQGLVLRQMCTECFQKQPILEVFHSVLYEQGKTPLSKDGEGEHHTDIHTDECSDQEDSLTILARNEEVAILRAENNCLREVVEDMRRALQSCDAKCLAMLVEVKKLHQSKDSHQLIDNCYKQKKKDSSDKKELTRVVQLVKEINRLREDRDKQLEEAIVFTQQLEAELWEERQKKETPAKCDKGIDATSIPGAYLQDAISPHSGSEDEGGVTPYRTPYSEGQSGSSSESTSDDDSIITSIPSGDWCFPNSGDDYSPVTRVNIANLEIEMKELKESLRQVEFERDAALDKSHQLTIDLDVESRGRKLDRRRYLDDITSLESDRIRLSAMEEELGDVIVLIMRLRDMNFSKRSIGKILFDIISDSNFCADKEGHNIENVAGSFIHSLHKELLHCDLMTTNGNLNPAQTYTTNGSKLSAKNGVSLKTNFYQFSGDDNKQEDCDPLKRPSGFPVDLIKSGFEMKC